MIFIQAFKLSDGRAALAPDWREAATPELLSRIKVQAQALCGEPVALLVCDETQAPVSQANAAEGLRLVASIEGGAVVEVAAVEEPCLWLHGAAEGGSRNPLTGTLYVRRGDTLSFAAAIRAGADPASAVVASLPGTDPAASLTLEWGLELRGVSGVMWCPMVAMVAGQASGSVVVPERLPDGDFHLPEELLARIGGHRLRLADPAAWAFKVVG